MNEIYKKKVYLETELKKANDELDLIKSYYPAIPIGSAFLTSISTIVAINTPITGLGVFAPIFGGFTILSWYLGHKELKEHKEKVSELEEKLKCL